MKYYVKDLDKENLKNPYPCTYCNHGSGSYSNGKDENGKYVEVKSCKDNGQCTKYELYITTKQ